MSFRELFLELKRRRVFRVAGIYVVTAFAALQGAQLLIESLKLPDWILSALTVVALIALPVVVALAWAFDVTPEGVQRSPPSSNSRVVAYAGVAMLIALIGFAAYTHFGHRKNDAADPDLSVAVLPFVNMSADREQEYFGDGITEEILNVLAKFPELRVPARTSSFSFKNRDVPVRQIAQQLNVRYVLEGSVRRSADQVRITAQLIDATSDRHLWSETYDRGLADIFAVQGEIATAIAQQLNLHMQSAVSAGTTNPQAHEAYLKGLYYWNRRHSAELPLAVDAFKDAISQDANYSAAYAGLALAYSILPLWTQADVHTAIREGKAAARRALELDPRNAQAHAALGEIGIELEWSWAAAQQHLDEALRIDPRYATAHQWRAELYMVRGEFDRALGEFDRAAELDPLSNVIAAMRAETLVELGRTDEGLTQLRALARADPQGPGAAHYKRAALCAKRWGEVAAPPADSVFRRILDGLEHPERRPAALVLLEQAARDPDLRGNSVAIAYFYDALGEPDSAAAVLDRTADTWNSALNYAAHSFCTRDLRGKPRFQAFVRKLNL